MIADKGEKWEKEGIEDGYGWCGGCVKLMGKVSELNRNVSELKEARQRNNVMLAVGELVSIVYQKIFEVATDIGLPEVPSRRQGLSVTIDLCLFLKYTKTKNEFKALLDAALVEIGLSREEYDILVAAKRVRYDVYYPTDALESLEILKTADVDDFSDVRQVLLSHRALLIDDIDG